MTFGNPKGESLVPLSDVKPGTMIEYAGSRYLVVKCPYKNVWASGEVLTLNPDGLLSYFANGAYLVRVIPKATITTD